MFWLLEKRLVAGGVAALSLLADLALLGLLGMVRVLDLPCIVEYHYHQFITIILDMISVAWSVEYFTNHTTTTVATGQSHHLHGKLRFFRS